MLGIRAGDFPEEADEPGISRAAQSQPRPRTVLISSQSPPTRITERVAYTAASCQPDMRPIPPVLVLPVGGLRAGGRLDPDRGWPPTPAALVWQHGLDQIVIGDDPDQASLGIDERQ